MESGSLTRLKDMKDDEAEYEVGMRRDVIDHLFVDNTISW